MDSPNWDREYKWTYWDRKCPWTGYTGTERVHGLVALVDESTL